MAKKRYPKTLWACSAGDWYELRKDARDECEVYSGTDSPSRYCRGCPGPVKYVREDK